VGFFFYLDRNWFQSCETFRSRNFQKGSLWWSTSQNNCVWGHVGKTSKIANKGEILASWVQKCSKVVFKHMSENFSFQKNMFFGSGGKGKIRTTSNAIILISRPSEGSFLKVSWSESLTHSGLSKKKTPSIKKKTSSNPEKISSKFFFIFFAFFLVSGAIFLLLNTLCYAIFLVFSKHFIVKFGLIYSTARFWTYAAPFIFLMQWPHYRDYETTVEGPWILLFVAIWQGVVCSVAYGLNSWVVFFLLPVSTKVRDLVRFFFTSVFVAQIQPNPTKSRQIDGFRANFSTHEPTFESFFFGGRF